MSLQQLILRSNRYLAAALLENRLITSDDVEKANAKLLSLLQTKANHNLSILTILIYELQALSEEKLINRLVDHYKVGLVHLGHFKLEQAPLSAITYEECEATMSIPFDRIGSAICIATCYYLSKPVIDHWQTKFENILWYTTSVSSLTTALEKIPREIAETESR